MRPLKFSPAPKPTALPTRCPYCGSCFPSAEHMELCAAAKGAA